MFSIITEQDFYSKVKSDYDKYIAKQDDSSLGINSLLSIYHLHEWVWALRLKSSYLKIDNTTIRTKADFTSWLVINMPNFELIQDLANGSKHCFPVIYSTSPISGYGVGPYGIGPYGLPYLLIDLGENKETRYKSLGSVLKETLDFWTDFFKNNLQ